MNNFNVYFKNSKENWIKCVNAEGKSYAVFPFNSGYFLDERLNEASLTLIRTPWDIFTPLTEMKIECLEENDGQVSKQEFYFIVANDKSFESPIGSKKWTHQLYLIERTKLLEGYICDSITFTNDLGNIFADDSWKV